MGSYVWNHILHPHCNQRKANTMIFDFGHLDVPQTVEYCHLVDEFTARFKLNQSIGCEMKINRYTFCKKVGDQQPNA